MFEMHSGLEIHMFDILLQILVNYLVFESDFGIDGRVEQGLGVESLLGIQLALFIGISETQFFT
jgi:hypothetical protein